MVQTKNTLYWDYKLDYVSRNCNESDTLFFYMLEYKSTFAKKYKIRECGLRLLLEKDVM